MNITDPIDKAYPKVKPLTQALVAAAKEQGATVEEFRMACARVEQMIERKAGKIPFSELQDREQIVSRFGTTEVTITKDKITGRVWSKDEDGKEERKPAPGGQDQERVVSNLERDHDFCGSHLLRKVVEGITAVCRNGGGTVIPLDKMQDKEDFDWALGLYRALIEAAEQYIGCSPGEKSGVCAVMCQHCREENTEHSEPICTGKQTCTRF